MSTDRNTDRQGPENTSRMSFGKIVAIVAVIVAIIFIVQNTGSGTVSFLFWEFDLPTWLWATGLFLLGGVSGYSFHGSRARARRKARRSE